jgi:hypothetical protein
VSIKAQLATSKLVLDKLSYVNMLKWRLGYSKKLVIIRPKIPGDAYTSDFSYQAAEAVKTKALAEGWTVTDLTMNNANRANVESTINSVKPDFIIHYDHGSNYTLYGQDSNASVAVLDAANASLFDGRAASTVSCESALGLGPLAVGENAKAYMGYDDLHWVHLWYLPQFTEAANSANYALLEGKTYQEAYNIAIGKYNEKYIELLGLDGQAAALMLHNHDHLTLVGDASAKARGLVISKISSVVSRAVIAERIKKVP